MAGQRNSTDLSSLVTFSPPGSYDKTVCIFSLGTDRLSKEHVFKGHGDSVDQLCWHPTKPDMLATASGDKTVRLLLFHLLL